MSPYEYEWLKTTCAARAVSTTSSFPDLRTRTRCRSASCSNGRNGPTPLVWSGCGGCCFSLIEFSFSSPGNILLLWAGSGVLRRDSVRMPLACHELWQLADALRDQGVPWAVLANKQVQPTEPPVVRAWLRCPSCFWRRQHLSLARRLSLCLSVSLPSTILLPLEF